MAPTKKTPAKNGYVPTGRPRGRRPGQKNKSIINDALTDNDDGPVNEEDKRSDLALPDDQKKSKSGYVATGKPRGRRPGQKNKNRISVTPNKNDDNSVNEKTEESRNDNVSHNKKKRAFREQNKV